MTIDAADAAQIVQLKGLWQLAFHDDGAFIDGFFSHGFAPERCRCVSIGGQVAAALYWFDCECRGQKMAYLYAVATHPDFQGRGLCRRLMADTHAHLRSLGYTGVLLVPQNEGLRAMYRKMGYRDCSAIAEFFCTDDPYPVTIHAIDPEEYGRLRKSYLPEGSVIQEGVSLTFLSTYAKFYKGLDFILAAAADGDSLFGMELLGNREAAPGVLCALGFSQGTFRTMGGSMPFAMFCPLADGAVVPDYFGFAFD